MSQRTSSPSLTEAGRDLAVELADCYVEVDVGGRFATKDECREFAASQGFDLLATGLGRDIYRVPTELLTADRDCVLKVPSRLIGSYENRREARYWRELPETVGEPPVQRIDIPDPRDPPSGCRFHTRCPEAREVCPREHPELMDAGPDHGAACFRVDRNHPYWNSPPLEEVEPGEGVGDEGGDAEGGDAEGVADD